MQAGTRVKRGSGSFMPRAELGKVSQTADLSVLLEKRQSTTVLTTQQEQVPPPHERKVDSLYTVSL